MVQMKWNANTILTFPIYRTGGSARRIILFGGKEEIDPKSGILADFLWNPRVSMYCMESDNCAARREIPGMVHGTQDCV